MALPLLPASSRFFLSKTLAERLTFKRYILEESGHSRRLKLLRIDHLDDDPFF